MPANECSNDLSLISSLLLQSQLVVLIRTLTIVTLIIRVEESAGFDNSILYVSGALKCVRSSYR